MHCSMCGAANADGATACVACGAALTPLPVQPTYGVAAAPPAAPVARPTGVAIVAVLDFIAAAFCVLGGISVLAFAGLAGSAPEQPEDVAFEAIFSGPFFFVVGGIIMAFAALYGALGWGLWKGRNWARIVHLVLAGLGVAGGLLGLLGAVGGGTAGAEMVVGLVFQLVWAGVAGFLIWYFVQPGVKRWFGA